MILFAVLVLLVTPRSVYGDPGTTQKLFERVFGDAVNLDPAMVAKVVEGKPGERHYVDRNRDGKPEEVWFIDTAKRHPQEFQPLLVRAIDQGGDLEMGGEPDLYNDLYVADWKADGTVDAVCEYVDRDGDGDVDEMGVYFPGKSGGAPSDTLMAWWGDDVGDDNLLWYDVGYTYRQRACQYRSHFGGDELFCAFQIGLNDPEWTPVFENPFLFYDHDRDGVTEETIRIQGRREHLENLRYSFDADHDATPDSPRDFDVSITAHAVPGTTIPEPLCDRRVLHGIPTGPFLAYRATPEYCRTLSWADLLLCWDENDLNIDGITLREGHFDDTQERWEGIIAHPSEHFQQVGGPTSGPFNKRFELATAPKPGLPVYYAPTDQRVHLTGANESWLIVDLDYDNQPDMRYDYLDTDGNGTIDTWRLDANGDGQPDDSWTAGETAVTDVPYTWTDVTGVVAPLMKALPDALFQLDVRLRQAAVKAGIAESDRVWGLIESGFDVAYLTEDLRLRLLNSNESLRYYLDILKDRQIATLKTKFSSPDFWTAFNALRAKGDLAAMRQTLETAFALNDPLPDFAASRAGILAKFAKPRVAWNQDWVPPNIGWESEVCGYRAYWGQFDFFGKKEPCLILPTLTHPNVNYHVEQDWGMDALHVDKTCGLGGVTLYVNDRPYPVWCPEGRGEIVWTKRLVSESPDQAVVELTADKVAGNEHPYTVRFRCTALAGRKDSPIEVRVSGGAPNDALALGIGITRLKHESFAHDASAGVLASWGVQDPVIGTIGLGVVYPVQQFLRVTDLPEEHQVVLKIERDVPVVYRIQGDWLNGRRFCRCPTLQDWLAELRRVP